MATQCRQFTNYGCAGFWYLLRLGQREWRWRRWSQVGGGRDDGWVFTHNLSGTTEINECVLLFLLSRTHKHDWFSFTHTGLSADLFPLTLSSSKNLDKWQKHKEDMFLGFMVLVLLITSCSPSCLSVLQTVAALLFHHQSCLPFLTCSFLQIHIDFALPMLLITFPQFWMRV